MFKEKPRNAFFQTAVGFAGTVASTSCKRASTASLEPHLVRFWACFDSVRLGARRFYVGKGVFVYDGKTERYVRSTTATEVVSSAGGAAQ